MENLKVRYLIYSFYWFLEDLDVKIVPKTLVFVERKIQSDRIAIALSLTGIKALSLNA
jgi:hypothetical protein